MSGIIEGDGDVQFAETGAKPDSLEVAVSSTALETRKLDLPQGIFAKYLIQMELYLHNNPTIKATQFRCSDVLPYSQFMGFELQDEGKLAIKVRPLDLEEYLSALKQTSPEWGALFEYTDLKELLPKDEFDLYNLDLHPMLVTLGFDREAGRRALSDLLECSRQFTYIPDFNFFSLFLANGAQLREYLETITVQPDSRPVFEVVNDSSRTGGGVVLFSNLPKTEELFAPSNVLNYVSQKGRTEVRGMMEEYEKVWFQVESMKSGQPWAAYQKYLYELLEKNNPALILK